MGYWSFVIIGSALLALWLLKTSRREMLLAGTFTLPVLFLYPLLTDNWRFIAQNNTGTISFFWSRGAIVFCIGVLLTGIYSAIFRSFFSPKVHPHRLRLRWLWSTVPLGIIVWFFHPPLIFFLLALVGYNVLLILIIDRHLFWDAFFAGFGFCITYLITFLCTFSNLPGSWKGNFLPFPWITGTQFYSIPLETALAVALIGLLIGPIYLSYKDKLRPSSDHYHVGRKKVFVLIIFAVLLGTGSVAAHKLFQQPTIQLVQPNNPQAATPTESFVVTFSHPVTQHSVYITTSPSVAGTLHFGERHLNQNLFSQAIFTPDQPLQTATSYVVTVNLTDESSHILTSYSQEIKTESLPEVVSSEPADTKILENPCDSVHLQLNHPEHNLATFRFITTPLVPLTSTLSNDGLSYSVSSPTCFNQATHYTLTALRSITGKDLEETVFTTSFQTPNPPQIQEYSPKGSNVSLSTKQILLTFSMPMSTPSLTDFISVSPSLPIQWYWQNSFTLAGDISTSLGANTTYTITVKAGLTTTAHTKTEQDSTLSFQTLAPPTVTTFYPGNGTTFSSEQIRVNFSQPVDHSVAQSKFSLTPPSEGTFSWENTTLYYTLANTLPNDNQYTVTIEKGIPGLEGLISNQTFSTTFSTPTSSFILPVSMHYQEHSLSCEVASLKMALNYRGISVSEDTLISLIGFDPTPRQGSVWGDPNKAFVGNIDGHQDTTGYGVYWGPIAQAANHYRSAQAFSGWTVSQMAHQLTQGNPIVFWGVYPPASSDPWTTPDGIVIQAWKGEHVRLLVGFTGPESNPSSFIINDPIIGRVTWSTRQFTANWSTFNNSGVVIF